MIRETERDRPGRFNNPYEESKWIAEALTRDGCAAAGVAFRILRPSIVIAHSVTHRISSRSGFYQVIDTLLQLGRSKRIAEAGPINLPGMLAATLDLIPVDVAAAEIVALVGAGAATAGRTFHVTGVDPLRLADVLRELTPMSGVVVEVGDTGVPPSPGAKVVIRRLRYYTPYFSFDRRFDRTAAHGALGTEPYRIDLEELRAFVRSYLAQQNNSPRREAA